MWSIAERFEVHLRLGAGGMGKVYLCRDRRAKGDGLVAVKVLREHGDGGDGYLEALIREFKILRHFEHPNIVRVLDAGTFKHAGRHRFWFSMEWIQGNNLLDYEWEDFPELGLIAGQVLSGLQAIHDAGFVHGDVKPQNILIGRIWSPREDSAGWRGHGRPVVKLLDFGLVMKARAREVLAGTPAYMAPEAMHQPERQSLSAQVGPASDLYSLGCVLYHVIARKLPYSGSDSEVQRKHADPAEWPAALAPRIPEYLRRLVERCMAKEPGARPQTASEVLSVLRENGMEELPATSRDSLAAFGMALNYVDPHGRAADLSRRIAGAMAGKGGPRTFYLDGPGGAGKSRLLREVKRLLAEDGVLVIRASGLDEGLHRIATKLAEACGSEMERQLFWRRHPHLTSRRPLSELPFDAIAENLAAAIRGVASRRRVVVAIDDAHHADRDVLHVLLLSARLLADHPVALLLLGDRAAAPGDVQETLAELAPPSAEVTGVATFDHRCVEDYLRAIFRAEPDGALTQYVLDASAGIPGAVATVVRHLHQTDEMVMGDGERVIALRSPVGDGGDVQEAVVSGLEAPERDVVEVLACLRDVPHEGRTGTELPAPAIAALARTTAAGVDGALQLLSSRGLAERVPTTGRHRIVSAARDVVLRTIPVEERRAIHRGIAEVLDGDDAIQLGRRARHLEKGGDATSASVAAMSAGKQLMERWKLSEAIDLAELVIRCTTAGLSPEGDRLRYEAFILKGDGLRLRARHAAAAASYREASELASAGPGSALMRARALQRLGDALTSLGSSQEASDALGEALPLVLSQANLPEHRPVLDEVLVTRGRSLMRSERHDDAIAVLERLLELRREVTPARVDAVLIDLARCRAMAHPHLVDAAAAELEELLARAERDGEIETAARAHEALGNILVIPDRLAPARVHVNKALEIHTRLGNERARAAALGNLLHLASHAGPFDVAERIARDLFDWHGGPTANDTTLKALICLARVRFFEGQYLPALEASRQAAAAIDQHGLRYLNEARVVEGQILAELRLPEAFDAFEAARQMAADYDATHVPTWVHEAQARMDRERGRGAAGEAVVEIASRALASAEKHRQVIYGALARVTLAEALSSRGPSAATQVVALVQRGVDDIAATRTPIYEMEVLHHAGRAMVGVGEEERALLLCTRALERHRGSADQNLGCLWRLHALRGRLEKDPREAARSFMAAGQIVDRLAQPLLRASRPDLASSYLDDPLKVEALTMGPDLLMSIKRGNDDE